MVEKYFLENLQQLMNSKRLNQGELAEAINTTQSTVSSWFARKTVPVKQIDTLAEFFKVEPHYFFMKPGSQGETKPLDDSNDFGIFLDDLAEKTLPPLLLAEWKRVGTKRDFVKILRQNYETDLVAGPNWYLALVKEVNKYTSIDLEAKLRAILEEKNKERNIQAGKLKA
jgi:transcriptional regulator with XRE-family HTH domain